MNKEKAVIGFIGAGGIARSHVFSLNSLKYFYDDAPEIDMAAVCSSTKQSRESFAWRFGFTSSYRLEEFLNDEKINTVFILGPNELHFKHFKAVSPAMPIAFIIIGPQFLTCGNGNDQMRQTGKPFA